MSRHQLVHYACSIAILRLETPSVIKKDSDAMRKHRIMRSVCAVCSFELKFFIWQMFVTSRMAIASYEQILSKFEVLCLLSGIFGNESMFIAITVDFLPSIV